IARSHCKSGAPPSHQKLPPTPPATSNQPRATSRRACEGTMKDSHMSDYKPQQLDKKWQQEWAVSKAFEVEVDPARPKFYCLEMFAYPSGHAHVGHVRNYIIGDVMARTKRMR